MAFSSSSISLSILPSLPLSLSQSLSPPPPFSSPSSLTLAKPWVRSVITKRCTLPPSFPFQSICLFGSEIGLHASFLFTPSLRARKLSLFSQGRWGEGVEAVLQEEMLRYSHQTSLECLALSAWMFRDSRSSVFLFLLTDEEHCFSQACQLNNRKNKWLYWICRHSGATFFFLGSTQSCQKFVSVFKTTHWLIAYFLVG